MPTHECYRGLIAQNQLNSAIQVLERCGKIITAGKLLIWVQNELSN